MERPLDKEQIALIKQQLPPHAVLAIDEISRMGVHLTLVGGAVRDFLINGILSKDLDFEVRCHDYFEQDQWLQKLEELKVKISQNIKNVTIESLSFGVFKIIFENEDSLELAPARLETFLENRIDHKNFEAIFISNLDYKEAFARRDITINAVGISFEHNGELILRDPTGLGESDIKKKLIRPVTSSFTKDPVRLLRSVRFALKFGFSYSKEFLDCLKEFNLSKITPYYFLSEGLKSNFYQWAIELRSIVGSEKIPCAPFMENFFDSLKGPYQTSDYAIDDMGMIVFEGIYRYEMNVEAFEFIPLKKKVFKQLDEAIECLKNGQKEEAFKKFPRELSEKLKKILE